MQQPTPFYTAQNLQPAYHLRYGWTAWPAEGQHLPDHPPKDFWNALADAWERDGLRMLEHQWRPEHVQVTFSARPDMSPAFLAARAKGRVQHALRRVGAQTRFARKFVVRSIGKNTRSAVQNYVNTQTQHDELADPRFAARLRTFAVQDNSVDLTQPHTTSSGRYWYNLHIVLVIADRVRLGKDDTLTALRDMALRVGRVRQIAIAEWSVMPDHAHTLVRPPPDVSPEQTVLWFQNNLAWAAGKCRVWNDTYYAGTCGEYTMHAVR